MRSTATKLVLALLLAAGAAALAWGIHRRLRDEARSQSAPSGAHPPAAVEVAPVERGDIVARRTFSGALEATAEFVVASKVSGRVEHIELDLADPVRRGQVVVRLEDDEPEQAVNQAQAELEVAQANRTEAASALEIAERNLARIVSLQERGVSSESQLDAARAEQLASKARVAVTQAQVARAEAALETARIRLGYAQVTAGWTGGDDERIVAERFVDEGETVSPNEPLLSIVELDPITGVFFVPERDYAHLEKGQSASLTTQAWPDDRFEGTIARIAPVFRQSSRQARVELSIPNADQRLKPGMFVRATVELERVAGATIVPEDALTQRDDRDGVFVLDADGRTVRWRPVAVGIREDGRAQVQGDGLEGRVVTLGQQLLDDGSPVVVPGDAPSSAPTGGAPE